MNKLEMETLLNIAINSGADFAEIYYEDSISKSYNFADSKLDTIKSTNTRGIGFRIFDGDDYYYASTNDLSISNLKETMVKLVENIKNKKNKNSEILLNRLQKLPTKVSISHKAFPSSKKKEILKSIDAKIRNTYEEVKQIMLRFIEDDKKFTIANSEGTYVESTSCHTRYICQVYTERENIKERELFTYGEACGYEFLDNFNLQTESLKAAQSAVEKLDAIDFKGGELPVIIAPGFGAVIFHEACGHGLEATSVAPKLSIFTNLLGHKIGSDKVTLIDDGTLGNIWGSNIIDDEGEKTSKNVLIEKGILKSYLVDKRSSNKMQCQSNGCSRRQSYDFAPTSRMSNTYLEKGTDKFEDMVKSINLGVYCEKLSGGTVNTSTGDFNFAVDTAHLIENGKITKRIRGVTLIGNGKDILNNVEMVSDDLKLADGYCGSKSGMIPVTIGQPTIKISKILVGGKE